MPETTPNPILFTDNGQVLRYAWPGGYPVFYVCDDGGALCPTCVQENLEQCQDADDCELFVTTHGINYENDSLYCDHCSETIESAYGG
jgi:hypothetical protein